MFQEVVRSCVYILLTLTRLIACRSRSAGHASHNTHRRGSLKKVYNSFPEKRSIRQHTIRLQSQCQPIILSSSAVTIAVQRYLNPVFSSKDCPANDDVQVVAEAIKVRQIVL